MVLVAVATSAILGQVLEQQLEAEVKSAQQSVEFMRVPIASGFTAQQILEQQPAPRPGFFLAVESTRGEPSAAVVDSEGDVVALTDDQIQSIADSLKNQRGQFVVTIDGLGTYRIEGVPLGNAFAIVGLSRAGITETLSRMLITIGLLTAGGLLLLAVATAWTIRRGLAPLRAVADTAARVSSLQLDQGEVSIAERVPVRQADPRTEVGRVGAALNTLLDHVDESLTARQRNEERMRSFVADASHELRTPLASIRGYSELSLTALGRGQSTALETTEASLERIQAQSLRMTSLVEDLLLLARLDEGQELVYGTVDLTRLAIDAVADVTPTGPDHEWVLEVGDEPVLIAGDTGRLHQVAANLLANARTHTPAGTTVTVSVSRNGHDAILRVHDDGPGIDPSIKDELFERFSRADRSRARQTGGTGLGLSIARAIVDAHGGSIRVESAPGDTTFEVRLPARPADPVVSSR
ncbi:HAMP domain-containing histidine kinase [Microbacterium trichothecenolyticum]|uniref:histidine kinase n=1 Tax=Microbacterium ureisolvens TaxID=2781186 RepID=A0ABS7I0G8_9MICO|nr:HAMP domain-containing histidine kinase [Microbacterium ureisolvens]MBW9121027.1 HAMP domain-containing histidine kinase [Microbacterium trichothecenolyticum]